MPSSQSDLHTLCSTGKLEELRGFLNTAIHGLPNDERAKYCAEVKGPCTNVPCTSTVTNLLNTASSAEQVPIFVYLWDTFLSPRGVSRIPWLSLHAAARCGSIPLAEAFFARDPDCFKPFVDEEAAAASIHGRATGGTQINTAMRNDRLEYATYILERGADVNHGCPIRASVRTEADDETTLKRVRFLIEHGARVGGTGTLQVAASLGRLSVIKYLLSKGVVNIDDVETAPPSGETEAIQRPTPLISAAAAGHVDTVQFLLQHGADPNFVDSSGISAILAAEQHHQEAVIGVLRNHH